MTLRWAVFIPESPRRRISSPRTITYCEPYLSQDALQHLVVDRQAGDPVEDRGEQLPGYGHFGQLERDVPRVPRYLRADLDQFLPQGGKRPVLHITGQCQPTQEVRQIVGQRKQL